MKTRWLSSPRRKKGLSFLLAAFRGSKSAFGDPRKPLPWPTRLFGASKRSISSPLAERYGSWYKNKSETGVVLFEGSKLPRPFKC